MRVEAFVSGGLLPSAVRGTSWFGLAHVSDWYLTLLHAAGVAVGIGASGGPRPLDSLDLWDALLSGGDSPRKEVILQVNNSVFSEGVSVIRVGDMKLIRGPPGDNRTIAWPQPSAQPVPLGLSGAVIETGTDHVRAPELTGGVVLGVCSPFCLYNVTADAGELEDLAGQPAFAATAAALAARLDEAAASGPPHAYSFPASIFHQKILPEMCEAAIALGECWWKWRCESASALRVHLGSDTHAYTYTYTYTLAHCLPAPQAPSCRITSSHQAFDQTFRAVQQKFRVGSVSRYILVRGFYLVKRWKVPTVPTPLTGWRLEKWGRAFVVRGRTRSDGCRSNARSKPLHPYPLPGDICLLAPGPPADGGGCAAARLAK